MKLGRFLTTLGIGALAGMLLAPKKGSELREELKDKGKETLDSAKEMTVEDYQKLISETIDSIKKTVDEFDVDEFKESSLVNIKIKRHGLLNGAIIGAVYLIFIYLISGIINKTFTLNIQSIILIISSMICGMIGGIIGINKK